jgi:hypothetical protein
MDVSIPGFIGCGLAGGDWNYVLNKIIKKIFSNVTFNVSIYYLGGEKTCGKN